MWSTESKKPIKAEIFILIIGGLLLWNTWVFGWLNHGTAGYTNMSISELNVPGQPYAVFFSFTEWLSGAFLLVSSVGLIRSIRLKNFFLAALVLIALIGALTIFDALRPVDCNRYQNPTCVAKIADGQISSSAKEHGVESRISDYSTILLALSLVIWALIEKMPRIELAVVIILATGVLASLAVGTNSIVYDSISQRVWNTLVSFDFLFVAYKMNALYLRKLLIVRH